MMAFFNTKAKTKNKITNLLPLLVQKEVNEHI